MTNVKVDRREEVNTFELHNGDIVQTHGMIVRLNEFEERDGVRWTVADVLNPGDVPMGYLTVNKDTTLSWTIQGNKHAKWCRLIITEVDPVTFRQAKYKKVERKPVDTSHLPYFWVIDRDRIEDGLMNGKQVGNPELASGEVHRFSCYDDDNVCYYTGRIFGDFTGFEPNDDFAVGSGCTGIKIDGEWL